MTSINEELKAAKAAISVLLTAAPKSGISTLRKANHIAILNLSSEGGPLNEARGKVGIALSNLMHGPPTKEKIDQAKGAVEDWINRLGAA